jgi:hypothetical protein
MKVNLCFLSFTFLLVVTQFTFGADSESSVPVGEKSETQILFEDSKGSKVSYSSIQGTKGISINFEGRDSRIWDVQEIEIVSNLSESQAQSILGWYSVFRLNNVDILTGKTLADTFNQKFHRAFEDHTTTPLTMISSSLEQIHSYKNLDLGFCEDNSQRPQCILFFRAGSGFELENVRFVLVVGKALPNNSIVIDREYLKSPVGLKNIELSGSSLFEVGR